MKNRASFSLFSCEARRVYQQKSQREYAKKRPFKIWSSRKGPLNSEQAEQATAEMMLPDKILDERNSITRKKTKQPDPAVV